MFFYFFDSSYVFVSNVVFSHSSIFGHILDSITLLMEGLYIHLYKIGKASFLIFANILQMWSLTENSLSSCYCFMDSLSLFCTEILNV